MLEEHERKTVRAVPGTEFVMGEGGKLAKSALFLPAMDTDWN